MVTERAIREPRGKREAGEEEEVVEDGREKRQADFEPYVPFKKRMKSTTTTEPPTTTTPAPYNVL